MIISIQKRRLNLWREIVEKDARCRIKRLDPETSSGQGSG